MIIILLGAPGVGKGSQAKLLSVKYKIPHISTGDVLRSFVINHNTSFAMQVKSTIEQGKLIEDDVIAKIVDNSLREKKYQKGFIMDGFPRTLKQAQAFDHIACNIEIDNDNIFFINLYIETDNVVKRLSGRFSCNKCGKLYNKYFIPTKIDGICDECGAKDFVHRKDDEEEVIKDRINLYLQNYQPILKYYHSDSTYKDNFYQVDAHGTIEQTFTKICSCLSKAMVIP